MEMLNIESFSYLVARKRPAASATLLGSEEFPDIRGTVRFYKADTGALVVAEVFHLPENGPFHAFHLHAGDTCGSGSGDAPFADSKAHYNPGNTVHPLHAGDFPPLLSSRGYAYASFYTGRFAAADAVGKTVIVHQSTDDFYTQPGGNAGKKIACGVVEPYAAPREQQQA